MLSAVPTQTPPEHLMGQVMKFASDNALTRTSAVLQQAGYPHHSCYDLAVNHLEFLPALADVIGCSQSLLDGLAHRAIRQTNTAKIIDFFGSEIPSYDLLLRSRRVAPHGVSDVHEYPAIWTHGLVGFCPLSGHELITTCALCNHTLGWRFVCEPWRCDQCGEDMRQLESNYADVLEMEAAAPALDLISPVRQIHQDALDQLPCDLRNIGAGAALDLLWRLAILKTGEPGETRANQRALTAKAKLVRATVASEMLTDWPHSAEALIADAAEQAADGNVRLFRRAKELLLRVPHYEKTEQLVTEKWGVNQHARAALSKIKKDSVFGKVAESIVGVTASDFARLARAEAIPSYSETGQSRQRRSYRRADLANIKTILDSVINIEQACTLLGLGNTALEQIRCLGLVDEIQHPAITALERSPGIDRKSVEHLQKCIVTNAKDVRFLENPVSLQQIFRAIGGREKPWGPLIQLLTQQQIQYGFAANVADCKCQELVFRLKDAPQVIALFFDPQLYPAFRFSATIGRLDLIEYLNLNPNGWDIGKIIELSGLSAGGTYPADRSAINAVGSKFISRHEIRARLELLGAESDAAQGRHWTGRTDAGWSREQIERYLGLSQKGVKYDNVRHASVLVPTQMMLLLSSDPNN